MTLYMAHNAILDATTTQQAGQSYAAGLKIAIQLQIPDNQEIRIAEWGWSQDASAPTQVELATTDAGSTTTSFLTNTIVKHLNDNHARASSLTYTGSGATTGFGNGAITTNTTLRRLAGLYVPQLFVQQYPLGQFPVVGNAAAENFLQMRVTTTATVNALAWIVWEEA